MPPIEEVPRSFLTTHYSFHSKISKLQSSDYRNVSTVPVGTSRGFLGIRGAHFGKHWCMVLNDETMFASWLQLVFEASFLHFKGDGIATSRLFLNRPDYGVTAV
jgi:hypothetical protein